MQAKRVNHSDIDRIITRRQLKKTIQADLLARGLDKLPLFYFYRKPLIAFTVLLRKVEYLENSERKLTPLWYLKLQRLRLKRMGAWLGLSITTNTCGPGLYLMHWGSIVISSGAKIGKNARIHSCVNIGKNQYGAPVIGDNVYIGPGAKIFGNIAIGNNVTIGANAVVNKSFPDGVTIAGVPAKIIRK